MRTDLGRRTTLVAPSPNLLSAPVHHIRGREPSEGRERPTTLLAEASTLNTPAVRVQALMAAKDVHSPGLLSTG